MAGRFVAPEFGISPFTCPHCETLAPQENAQAWMHSGSRSWSGPVWMALSKCGDCIKGAVWILNAPEDQEQWWSLVYPEATIAPSPNADLPEDIRADYLEAAAVASKSPRSAAALLRLCVQKLCVHFGQPGKNINDDIGALVKEGTVRPMIQRAMDTVRISGNESVHPGVLNLSDDLELVRALFDFVNLIADEAITQPGRVDSMWQRMPEAKLRAVEERDHAS